MHINPSAKFLMTKFSGTTVLFSGGIDSTACIHFLRKPGKNIRGVFIDFGQAARHQEFSAASKISMELDFPLETYVLSDRKRFISGEIFGRNAFLIFACIMLTQQHSGLISIGVHSGTPYYDCSQSFLRNISHLLEEQSDGMLRVIAPFIEWNKEDIYDYFTSSQLPIKLIYSCEFGGDRPCGQCASCKDHMRLGIM